MSGDLRNHAVVSFIEPVFERLGQRPGLTLHAYYNHTLVDTVTERLRGHLPHWRDVAALDDDELERQVRAGGIDILIGLSGHTVFNRLPAFARRLAPVQASWNGYPGTTGLAAMDYYLVDRKFLPHGQYDHLFVEKLVQLPLLVGGMPEQHDHAQLRAWLDHEGIAAHRVEFHGRIGLNDYLKLHQQVDLCLDTFPYPGGTTTMHAGWMGLPTLTLDAGTVTGRQTACFLEHCGLHHFVAKGLAICGDLRRWRRCAPPCANVMRCPRRTP